MFNLGYKQIIINSNDAVTVDGTIINIAGFGSFDPAQRFVSVPAAVPPNKWKAPAVDAAVGKYTVTVPGGAAIAGNAYNVKVYFSGAPRILSELFSGGGGSFGDAGEIMTFQSSRLAAVDTLGLHLEGSATVAGAIIPDFNDSILKFVADGANFKMEVMPGYEGIGIAKVSITNADDQDNTETFLAMTVDQEPTEGIGTGRQIEAEVRNATFDNIDPWGVQFGGNSSVDVRGKYTTYYWEMKASQKGMGGWEPHDMLGYGDANTETLYGSVKFIAYVNEASATAAGGLLDALIA